MLTFNLTTYFYNMVSSGSKDVEYREYKEYWIKRLNKVKPGDSIRLVNGYTSEYIEAIITEITIVPYAQLPELVKNFFVSSCVYEYYAIQFQKKKTSTTKT